MIRLSSLLLALGLLTFTPCRIMAQSTGNKHFVVTIDAGHGGKDTGAPGKKSVEKNIALAIALKLGHYIESLMNDVDVYYTRKTDVFIPLYERGQIANKNKSDLFISIHVNANKKSAPFGTTTYVMGFSKSSENLDLVMQENKAMLLESDYKTKYAGFDPTSPESYIIFNNVQNNNLSESLELATGIQDQLRISAQRKDLGVNQGNLVVLWTCAKPSVLIETGFISNPNEEQFLMSDDGQDQLASAIYKAFRNYKESVDNKADLLGQSDTPASTTASPVQTEPQSKVQDQALAKKDDSATRMVEAVQKSQPEVSRKDEKPESAGTVLVDQGVTETPKAAGVEYRVQVMASPKKVPAGAKEFKGVRNLEEFRIDGYYKYLSQPVKTYQEALDLQRKLGASFKGAFIVAFKDGKRVPLDTVREPKNQP